MAIKPDTSKSRKRFSLGFQLVSIDFNRFQFNFSSFLLESKQSLDFPLNFIMLKLNRNYVFNRFELDLTWSLGLNGISIDFD